MKKILVIRFSSLGDVILTLPVFEALRRAWPDAHLTALTKEEYADVLAGAAPIQERLLLRRGESLFSLVQRVRRGHYDLVIDLHSNLRSWVVSLFSGASRTVRYRKAVWARRLYVRWRLASPELQDHTLDRYMHVLGKLGIETPSPSDPHAPILVVQTAFLGDAVLTLPFLNSLRIRYPAAPITVLCTPEISEIFEHHPAVSDLVIFDKRGRDKGWTSFWRIARELRARRFSIAFLPHRSFKSAFIAWLASIPRRIGFSRSQGRFLLTDVVPFHWGVHDADRNLALLKAVGGPVEAGELFLTPDPSTQKRIEERLQAAGVSPTDRVVGVNAGSLWPTKRWRAEGFATVADRVIRELGMKVIFFGGRADGEIVNRVMMGMSEKPVNWVGQTNLKELIAAVSRCEVFLTNDSGPMHIAVACRVPTVAIFGPTTKELGFFPYGPGHIVIEKDLACRPCGLHGAEVCPLGHFKCMNDITPEEVFGAVVRQRKRTPIGVV